MSKVFLSKCENYDLKQIEDKIREGFMALGGDEYIKTIIKKNSKVLLKPNMIIGDKRESLIFELLSHPQL